jgi:hypothetical protein
MFGQLHRLKREGIIESVPPRLEKVTIGGPAWELDTTSFCAINASAWANKATSCRHWQLRINGATLSDHLAIHHGKTNREIATALAVLAMFLTILIAII